MGRFGGRVGTGRLAKEATTAECIDGATSHMFTSATNCRIEPQLEVEAAGASPQQAVAPWCALCSSRLWPTLAARCTPPVGYQRRLRLCESSAAFVVVNGSRGI
eukprot:TRINITY_DN9696_c0_g1_i2.p1 TRINITY_DN9696_c0_g1~~TRINITY_DN9696_c0_g1_i2.p1  ORF type:complete len:113 (+),score=6.37 TRINITY_DN9696_c0_g1_i2:30-341(+)